MSRIGRRTIRESVVERMIDDGVLDRLDKGEDFTDICREYKCYPSNVFAALKHPARRKARGMFRQALGDLDFDKILDTTDGDNAPEIKPTPAVPQAKFHVELPSSVTELLETLSTKTGWDPAYIIAGTVEQNAAAWCKDRLRKTLDDISEVGAF